MEQNRRVIEVPTREELAVMSAHDLRNRIAALDVLIFVLRRRLERTIAVDGDADGVEPVKPEIAK